MSSTDEVLASIACSDIRDSCRGDLSIEDRLSRAFVHGNTGQIIEHVEGLPWWTLHEMADCLNRHGWRAKPPPRPRKNAVTVA